MQCKVTLDKGSFRGIWKANLGTVIHFSGAFEQQDHFFEPNGCPMRGKCPRLYHLWPAMCHVHPMSSEVSDLG